jgi:exodeoxyribonuclease VII small subunit
VAEQDGVRTFEAALDQMEEIARALEEGQLSLDEAIAAYERGMRLYQVSQTLLDRADLRVRRLATSETGEIKMEELETDVEP